MQPICDCCKKNLATQKHHKFPQRKWAKNLYGDLIHDNRNLQDVCYNCHIGDEHPRLIHWTEKQFCDALGIQMKSKIGRQKWTQKHQ
jgi:hypothetical protein